MYYVGYTKHMYYKWSGADDAARTPTTFALHFHSTNIDPLVKAADDLYQWTYMRECLTGRVPTSDNGTLLMLHLASCAYVA